MFKKWVVTITLSLSLLSGVAIGADSDELISYTKNIAHNHGGGGKGMDTIPLLMPETKNHQCAVFNSAKIEYSMRRYGNARITTQPLLRCDPRGKEGCALGISWRHAPAGGLDYRIKVGWVLQRC
ncbi:MAG: hypothetical protein KAG34_09680 [Cocleimonas sp.]|nr:hypothetical protein [Cocleimonas sp.]